MSSKNSSTYKTKRTKDFQKNVDLEVMLEDVNGLLGEIDTDSIRSSIYSNKDHPVIFVMGPHRSGSTLFMQWIANTGNFAYPTNLLSRFYASPIVGAKIQLLLTDPRYNFRDEILDFNSPISFESENGKTKGALAPNEFWYFWRKFLPDTERDYWINEELFEKADIQMMLSEFAGITDVFQKPFALKGMNLNYNIAFLNKVFDKAIFIHTKRDPLTNIASILKARERQLGSIENWYSFKIPEYVDLIKLNPYEQAAGQVYFHNQAVENGLKDVAEHKKITINYEDFCSNPKYFYDELVEKLNIQGYSTEEPYSGEKSFSLTRKEITDEKIINANRQFES